MLSTPSRSRSDVTENALLKARTLFLLQPGFPDGTAFPHPRRKQLPWYPTARAAYNRSMRRLALIATLAWLIAPASAQVRSGGHAGGMGVRSGGFASHAPMSGQGRHFGGPAGSHFSPGFGNRFGRPFDGRFHHHHHFFRGGIGFGWGFPVWGYYDPFFADYSFDQSDYYAAASRYQTGMYDQQAAIEQRLDRVEDRINRLLDRLQASPPAPPQAQYAPPDKSQSSPAATLVFRDGHAEQIDNYAVVGQTLWIFNEQRARKVPLAQINVEATEQANQQRGIDLHLPRG